VEYLMRRALEGGKRGGWSVVSDPSWHPPEPPIATSGSRSSIAPTPFVHRAVLYGDDAEAAAVVAAQLLTTVARGDPAVAVLGTAVRRAVEELLGAAADAVHFRNLSDVHAESVEMMIGNYLGLVDELLEGGRVSTVVEYDSAHPHDGTRDFCYRIESAVNIAAALRPVDNTCLYDLRAVSGQDIAAARRTHPLLVVGGLEGPNPELGDLPVPTFVVVGRQGLVGLRAWVGRHAADAPAEALDDLILLVSEAVTAVVGTGAGTWVNLGRSPGRYTCRTSPGAGLPVVAGDALLGGLPAGHQLHDLAVAAQVAAHGSVRTHDTPQGLAFEVVVPR
jgi:MEDS: MEthanogen/methylotroph, DcmR Sensory domain